MSGDGTQTTETTQAGGAQGAAGAGGEAGKGAEGAGANVSTQAGAAGGEQAKGAAAKADTALGGAAKDEKGAGEASKQEAGKAPADVEVKLPEGFVADEKLLGEFKGVAKELGLKSEGAQKLVELFAKSQTAAVQQRQAEIEKLHKGWEDALKSDKDFGGAQLEQNVAQARRVVEKYGDADLKQFLNETGLGNHPALFRFVARIAKADAEDSVAGATGGGRAPDKSPEARYRSMYPTMFKEAES